MKKTTLILLMIIIILGIVLRTIFFGFAPPALNIDEAALGYNAYSILKTGKDEHGVFLPMILESFGDWKLPIYSYASIIFISIFGLNEFSIRAASIAAGIAGVILIYLISQKLFNKRVISLISAFLFAISPWSIHFSRAAYEVNLATTFFLVGLLCFLYGISKKRRKIILFFSACFFGITLFTYHSYIIFMPLFFISLTYVSRKKLLKSDIFLIYIIFSIFLTLSIFTNFSQGINKATTTSIFNNPNIIYKRVENFSKDTLGKNIIFEKIHSKYLGIPYHFAQNYLLSFSPIFLFDIGGEKLVHNIDGFGNLYLIDALFLLFGLCGIFYNREKNIKILIPWIILAPIPSALTIDAPNSTRLFTIMPLFVLISSYGLYFIFSLLRHSLIGRFVLSFILILFILNILFFLDLYFIHNNYHRAQFWRYGEKELVEISNRYAKHKIIVRGPENFHYIYFLFYNKYNPEEFRKKVTYYPKTEEGFRYVKSFDRYYFVNSLQDVTEERNILYIDDQNFNQGNNLILLPNKDPIFRYYEKK